MERSAEAVTVSVSEAVLFPGVGSVTGLLSMVAVLVRLVPGKSAATANVRLNVVELLGVSAAVVVQVMTPLAIVQRESLVEPVVFAGIVSLTTTPAGTVDGPLLVSVIVYVVEVPAVTLVTPSLLLIDRSADLFTVSVSDALLFPGVGSGTGLLSMLAVLVRLAPGYSAVPATARFHFVELLGVSAA